MLIQLGGQKQPAQGPVELLLECHERIRTFVALARRAGEQPDATAAEIVDACERVERYFTKALPLHVADEEQSLLPRLRGTSVEVDRALEAMAAQHAGHEAKLRALLSASSAVRARPGDAAGHRALFDAADELARDFDHHLADEERIVFPLVRALPAGEQAEIVAEVRRRRHPGA
ncbi:MAG: hemerythrin domain-containing protein [Myxococcaceae bacterium]|nr:hemerythrin domain-containing protein [Myxococcaceae bacterium]